MSRTGEYYLEILEQERIDWIRNQLDDEDADENTEGWDEYAQEWDYRNYDIEAQEYEWFEQHSYNEIHRVFNFQLEKLKELVSIQVALHHEETFYKMCYAHAVTLMESFLSDTVRSLVVSDDRYFFNAIRDVGEIAECKFTLEDYAKSPDGAKGLAMQKLAKIMYHNIPKVKAVLQAIIGKKLSIDISHVSKITYFRHDIVHRDGKSIDGELIKVDREIVDEVIKNVETFVSSIAQKVEEVKNV